MRQQEPLRSLHSPPIPYGFARRPPQDDAAPGWKSTRKRIKDVHWFEAVSCPVRNSYKGNLHVTRFGDIKGDKDQQSAGGLLAPSVLGAEAKFSLFPESFFLLLEFL